jgi:ectoine utilization protein EutC
VRAQILTESEIRQAVALNDEAIAVVEDGFTRLAAGDVTVPPIMRIDVRDHNGEVDVKSAYVRGLDGFAIKISSGFFDNHRLGLPSLSGMMVLLSAETGIPQAVLLDNGYLTDVRTGAAGAVAAKYLARTTIETAGVIGSGAQARYQMLALKQVRNFQRLLVFSRSPAKVAAYAEEMAERLGVEVVPAPDAETVARQSDVVVTTTPSKTPYLDVDWLRPGLHITAMGSDAEEKHELRPAVLKRADLIVCDLRSQCFRLGELHHARDAGVITDPDAVIELGQLTAGRAAGRTSDEQITVCDLTGVGVQDTVIAHLARRKASAQGQGIEIEI